MQVTYANADATNEILGTQEMDGVPRRGDLVALGDGGAWIVSYVVWYQNYVLVGLRDKMPFGDKKQWEDIE